MDPKSNGKCFHKRTERKKTGKQSVDRSRDWSNVSTSQRMSGIIGNHQKQGEGHGMDFVSETLEGTNPAETLNSDFRPPEL